MSKQSDKWKEWLLKQTPSSNLEMQLKELVFRGKAMRVSEDDMWYAFTYWADKHNLSAGDVALAAGAAISNASKPAPLRTKGLTDTGNAERVSEQCGEGVRYCHDWNTWLVWDGKRWGKDRVGAVEKHVKNGVRNIFVEAEKIEDDADLKEAINKHARSSESAAKRAAMMKLASSEGGIPVTPEQLDANRWLLNCESGIIDLRSGELKPRKPHFLCTKMAPYRYTPGVEPTKWLEFLSWVFRDDHNLVDFMQRAVGYSLTGSTRDHHILFCHGAGANGKGTVFRVLLKVMGDYASAAPPDLLIKQRSRVHPTDMMFLRGLRMAVGSEVAEGAGFDEAKLKMLTGGDAITARGMKQDFTTFDPTHTLWLSGNHKPRITGPDHGIWRRMVLIPFDNTIGANERNADLDIELLQEGDAILSWAVDGAVKWFERGLDVPASVVAETKTYREEEDVFGQFLEECTNPCNYGSISRSKLRGLYEMWCKEQGIRPMSARAMCARMRKRGHEETKKTGAMHWKGVIEGAELRASSSESEFGGGGWTP